MDLHQMSSSMSFSPFYDLPVELQIRIMIQLDPRSILACRKASHILAQLVDDSVEIQYQLELSIAGMIEGTSASTSGSPGSASVRDRLKRLRAYREAYANGRHPVQRLDTSSSPSVLISHRATNVVWYTPSQPGQRGAGKSGFAGHLNVYRPSGIFSGTKEHASAFRGVDESAARYPRVTAFLVDIEEDLLVYAWNAQEPLSDSSQYATAVRLHCGFASLSAGDFTPHPCAPRPILPLCVPTFRLSGISAMQSVGELIALSTLGAMPRQTSPVNDMIVFNWKTGTIVWHMHGEHFHAFRLISPMQTVVVDMREFTLSIFTMDPGACADCPLTTHAQCACTLRLPARHRKGGEGEYHSMGCFVSHAPSNPKMTRAPDDSGPLFSHDPDHTLLVLQVVADVPGTYDSDVSAGVFDKPNEHYLIIIPRQTIDAACQIPRLQAQAVPHRTSVPEAASRSPRHSLTESPAGTELPASSEASSPPIILWEEWGPSGSRIVRTGSGIFCQNPSMVGSQISMTYWDRGRGECVVSLYDVHPFADVVVPSTTPERESGRDAQPSCTVVADSVDSPAHVEESTSSGSVDRIEGSVLWRDTVCTSYPVRKTTRIIKLEEGEEQWSSTVLLGRDGLVLVKRKAPEFGDFNCPDDIVNMNRGYVFISSTY
ncbi:hypothetical protein FKP32DRAFT_1688289 [Trametes sanguinea]|nr:hypothetical protein FKP32DRAFT_1688289 [Trametes sanguinea]